MRAWYCMAKRSQHAVYLTEEERNAREERAEALDMSFSQYMREETDSAEDETGEVPAENN